MARYEFLGGDPIDHFTLGRINPGDVVELQDRPDEALWKPVKRATKTTHADDKSVASTSAEEG